MRLVHPGCPAFVKIFHIAAIMITAMSNPTNKPAELPARGMLLGLREKQLNWQKG
jgi:hypothetical protein